MSSNRLTFTQAQKIYFLDKQIAPTTVKHYSYFFGLFSEYLDGDPLVESITTQQVKRFLTWVRTERGLAKKTAALAHTALSSFWSWAEAELGCEHILRDITRPKYQEKLIQIYTADEVKRLLQAAQHITYTRAGKTIRARRPYAHRDTAIILTLLDTGIRASELCSLLVSDYDTETGRILIRLGKGDKQRAVYAGRRCQRAIVRYLVTRPDARPGDPLFAAGEFGDSHLDRSHLLQLVKKLGNHAGVTGVFVHRFRHTMAVAFLRAGGGLAQLRLILGHADLRTVLNYARLAEIDLQQAARDHSPADDWKL